MSGVQEGSSETRPEGRGEGLSRLTWVSHPAREQPIRMLFATGIVLATSLSILWADGDAFLSLLGAAILLVSIAPFLLPTRFTLTQHGVIVQMPPWRTRRRSWEDLRRWEEDGRGVFLSPFSRPRRFLDGRRGIYLRGGDRGAIRDCLRRHLGEPREGERGE